MFPIEPAEVPQSVVKNDALTNTNIERNDANDGNNRNNRNDHQEPRERHAHGQGGRSSDEGMFATLLRASAADARKYETIVMLPAYRFVAPPRRDGIKPTQPTRPIRATGATGAMEICGAEEDDSWEQGPQTTECCICCVAYADFDFVKILPCMVLFFAL